jgi:predicted O-methyltransferase YrrM
MRQSAERAKQMLKGPLTVAEIGVCSGFNALMLLTGLEIKKMYLVDPYEFYDDGNQHKAEPEMFRFVFLTTMPFHDRVQMLRYPSEFVASFFPPRSFDYVYLDGLHTYEGVKKDIECWWPLVKDGGILAGHDYNTQHVGVKKAVDECPLFGYTELFRDTDWMVVK